MSQTTIDSENGAGASRLVSDVGGFRLVGVAGPAEGLELRIDSGERIVGRSRSCDLRILDDQVSRQHLRLCLTHDGNGHPLLLIEDLASRNGVRVNGRRTGSALLDGGDTIHIGRSQLRLDSI
jgi:pSer/pThr/pTyr-binding forkhead associated (FHA) protein